ncbi:MAG: hypothetical protein QM758_17325 [Armatimonas sp.]
MKPIDKKDQPKLFALVGMAVVAFGFGAYQFATSSTAQPVAPKASPSPAANVAQGGPGDPAAADPGTWKPEGQQDMIPIGGRDPFMPEGLAAPQPSPTPVPPPKPTPEPHGPSLPPGGGSGPLVIPPPTPHMTVGDPAPSVKIIVPTPTPPPPAPSLDLSGVIVAEDGNRSKAIFKSEKANRILGIGDAAGNGWRIADIQERKVEIIDPKTGRRATVELD